MVSVVTSRLGVPVRGRQEGLFSVADLPGLFPLVCTSLAEALARHPGFLEHADDAFIDPAALDSHWRAPPQPSSLPTMPATQIPFCRELDATDVSPDEMSVLSDSRLK
jgi:hypothetical protein